MTRWGEFDDLCHIDEMEETKQETAAEDTKDNRGNYQSQVSGIPNTVSQRFLCMLSCS